MFVSFLPLKSVLHMYKKMVEVHLIRFLKLLINPALQTNGLAKTFVLCQERSYRKDQKPPGCQGADQHQWRPLGLPSEHPTVSIHHKNHRKQLYRPVKHREGRGEEGKKT